MSDEEQILESLQVGSLEEGMVRPSLIRPAMETKITTPEEEKGFVPPPLVHLPEPVEPVPALIPTNLPEPAPVEPTTTPPLATHEEPHESK
jgi:hypothetical protein